MPAWRCPNCLTNWPPGHQEFDKCPRPECDRAETEAIRNINPTIELDEALSLYKNWLFEKKYARWEKDKDPERLVPTADERVKYPFRPELGDRRTYAERHGLAATVERKGLLGTRKT